MNKDTQILGNPGVPLAIVSKSKNFPTQTQW